MAVSVQRPNGINVGVNNPGTTVYIANINPNQPANETTDGSIRFNFTAPSTFANIESRANGVWNDTGLRISSQTLEIGRDLLIGASGAFIETDNISFGDEHDRALIPHISISQTGTGNPHTPIADELQTTAIFSGAVGIVSGTTISEVIPITYSRIVDFVQHEVGAVGATSQIQYSVYVGTDNTGSIISRQNLPASAVVANTTMTVDFDFDIGFRANTNYFFEMVTDSTFELKTDISNNILTSFDEQRTSTLDLLTDSLVLNNDLSIAFANDLSIVTYSPFENI